MAKNLVSIVVPTLNEEGNVGTLIKRVNEAFRESPFLAELIFIDDHSTDATCEEIKKLKGIYADTLPISLFLKQGHRGKSQSLIEGFAYAKGEFVAMIDADLQYPPEAIPAMTEKLFHGADIIVANRKDHDTGFLRKLLSWGFQFVFAQLLHDLTCDSQSGLKVFRKKILHDVVLDPTPWTFDLEFLLSARNYGYVIDTFEITFAERLSGTSKLNPLEAVFEIGWSAIQLKYKGRPPLLIHPESAGSMHGAGIAHKRQRFVTHTTLHHSTSALETFMPWQWNLLIIVALVFILGLVLAPLQTGITFFALLTIIYFTDVFFNLGLVLKSLKTPPEIESTESEIRALDDETLPVYSVLCPLYKEAHMLPHFTEAIEKMNWPKKKLDVLLLLEENDQETVKAAQAMGLPEYVRIVVVPHSFPKTKPKACNYGLSVAYGEYVVIYDAEDIPDPDQLKKAYLAFQKSGPEVQCLQAKLNYFNPHQNMLTRLFTAEYSLWFDVILTGLQTINTSIPLGGTSNHFRTKELLELEGWDPFNVTEDCDLGVRLFKKGYRTAIIDSVTLEEANSDWKNWLRQRSRWIKGYMQTYLVHMRNPVTFTKENGVHALIFQLVVGGKIAFMLINPLLWITTIAYYILYSLIGPTIQSLFPPVIFYMASISLVFGNFLYLYYYMIGCAKRKHFGLMKYVFAVPFYWIMVSIAAAIAAYELFVKPHYWQKTNHGLHIVKKKTLKNKSTQGSLVGKVERMMPHFIPSSFIQFVFSGKGVLMVALIFGNFLNFAFNTFLGRMLSFNALALVILVTTLWYIATIFIGGFASATNHRVSYLDASKGKVVAWHFLVKTLQRGTLLALGISLLWVVATPWIANFFHVEDLLVLLLFTPAFIFGLIAYAFQGFLQGMLRFQWVAGVILAEALAKLIIAGVFVYYGLERWVYASIPLSLVFAAVIGGIVVWVGRPEERKTFSQKKLFLAFPHKFFLSAVLASVSSVVFLSVDILLVKHFFEEETAGQYSLLSLIGKMVYFLGTLPVIFMITLVSRKEGLSQSPKKIFTSIFASVLALVSLGVVLFGFFGFFTAPLLFGEKAHTITALLPLYSLGIALFTLSNVIVLYHLARRHYLFSFFSLVISLLMTVGIWFYHEDPAQVVKVVFLVSLLSLGFFVILHSVERKLPFLRRSFDDFLGIFTNGLPKVNVSLAEGRRILIFNWRDSKHLYAGGAELYVHEIAKAWVADGNQVTIFCGNDGRERRHEVIDGINIVRRGGFYLVYLWAFLYYMFRFRGKYDIVIDCENGIPFFTPMYVRKPIFCLMHHVHQEVFRHSLIKPLAIIAGFMEKRMMPLVYRKVKFITVSNSSRDEMLRLGLGKAGVQIVHPGVHLQELIIGEKSLKPTVLYLGRLKAYKSIDVLIRAFHLVVLEYPEATLMIAGSGEEDGYLKRLACDLGLSGKQVQFLGKVDEVEKLRLLQSAWMLVNPSFMEGWGIVVIEANACGTPVIASDIPGLRDSVKDTNTGYLVEYGDSKAFAERILQIIRDTHLREDLSTEARHWAENFSWKKSSQDFLAHIKYGE